MKKYLKIAGFGSMVAVIVMMIVATFMEKLNGSSWALSHVYHNPIFMVLWGLAAICGLWHIISEGNLRKKWATLLLHIAFAVILTGALITHLNGQEGQVRLDPGVTVSQWVMEDGTVKELPALMTLDEFEIESYPGSRMPMDYRSNITVGVGTEAYPLVISMNKIGKIDGYRFYQSDYDGDSSILMVVRDPWGVGVTYLGYILLLAGLLGFFFQRESGFCSSIRRLTEGEGQPRQFPPKATIILRIASGALLAYLTFTLGRSWVISGHAPFVGSYAFMMVMAWMSALAMSVLGRRFPSIFLPGFLLSFFTMVLAFRAGAGSSHAPLAPVLRSPLLAIHVLAMMISYTLFGLAAIMGILGLCRKESAARLQDLSLTALYPGVFLLTFGTFIGAVWANISWGSYWSWDPKETWALITLLVYLIPLHGNALKAFKNPRIFHIYAFIAFLSVLITYFGVNLILGGMHSYS